MTATQLTDLIQIVVNVDAHAPAAEGRLIAVLDAARDHLAKPAEDQLERARVRGYDEGMMDATRFIFSETCAGLRHKAKEEEELAGDARGEATLATETNPDRVPELQTLVLRHEAEANAYRHAAEMLDQACRQREREWTAAEATDRIADDAAAALEEMHDNHPIALCTEACR